MLTSEQAAQLKEVLLAEKRRLLRNAQEGLSFSMNRDRNAVGRDSIDESMEEEIFSTELRLRDRENFLLRKINSALERVEQNSVDACEDCGEPIGFKRLLARPVTTLCIGCKEQQEHDETSLAAAKGTGGAGLPTAATEAGDFEEGVSSPED